jgi:hypothetical protein
MLRTHIGPRLRLLYAIAVLADRREHTIRELGVSPQFLPGIVSEATVTRQALEPAIAAGLVIITRRNAGVLYMYQLAYNPESGVNHAEERSAS